MNRREDEVRERFQREADILQGLGGMPGLDDLRAYGEELQWAAVSDGMTHHEEHQCQACGDYDCHGECMHQEVDQ